MRPSRLLAFSLLPLTSLGATALGCYDAKNDCNLFDCGAGGGTTTTTSGTGGGTGGGGGGTPTECVPSEATGPVAGGCGVFVSPDGADGNPGTKEKPMATLGAAAEKAKDAGKRVYACAKTFTEAATIATDVTIYGGLDCDKAWEYSNSNRTEWTAGADEIPLHIGAGISFTLLDVNVTAHDASTPGTSSIAILVENGATVDIARAEVRAGLAAAGKDGDPYSTTASDGASGAMGVDACTVSQANTPNAPVNDCGDIDSIGGSGGTGAPAQGSPGSPGQPEGDPNGGAGEGASACKLGTAGVNGTDGPAGAGATGIGLIGNTGYAGASGMPGSSGAPAQGGGGGGGSKGGTGAQKCADATKAAGASGGSGGSGGCGGLGGQPGGPGGSSIGILSLGATLTFTTVTITAQKGGDGGNGGEGQIGGAGAPGGNGGTVPPAATLLKPACKGGTGGDGGKGGIGGGGLGGHSIGIAFLGDAPDAKNATIFVGQPGVGGDGELQNDASKGASGIAKDIQLF